MTNPPKLDRAGKAKFEQKKGKWSCPVGQTIKNLNEQILAKCNKEKKTAKTKGKSKARTVNVAQAMHVKQTSRVKSC